MEIFEKFIYLFADVWKEGIAGVNFTEIFIAISIFFYF